jgi:glutaredoxin
MPKNLLWIIIGAVVVLSIGALVVFNNFSKPEINTNDIILFYGKDCPHCKIVDEYVAQNKVEDKVKFTRLEVSENRNNSNLLVEKAKICGLDINQIGVPFLWNGQSCFMGDPDVVKFFKDEVNKSNQ